VNVTYCKNSTLREAYAAVIGLPAPLNPAEHTTLRTRFVREWPDHEVSSYLLQQTPSPAVPSDPQAPLPPAWEIRWSYAQKGLGPLLYDIAMEAAALLGASLTSDREEVSTSAQKIWDYYDTRRPDITSGILDDEIGTLTPDDSDDDCRQDMSKLIAGEKGDSTAWHQEPISRAFTIQGNRTPNIDAFRAVGRFDSFGFPEGIFG
jgi:hypothetical protein